MHPAVVLTYVHIDLHSVKIIHKKREGLGDWIASTMVSVARTAFDIATRYPKHRERFPRIAGADKNKVKVGTPRAEEQKEKAIVAYEKGEAIQSKSTDLPEEMQLGEMRRRGLCFGPEAWLVRIVFLESVAGVPVSKKYAGASKNTA